MYMQKWGQRKYPFWAIVFGLCNVVVKAESVIAQAASPLQGEVVFDTKGRVPGDSANGIEDLKKLYAVLNIYRERHEGKQPADATALIKDLASAPKEYGFQNYLEARSLFSNPDVIYADGLARNAKEVERIWPYELPGIRLDSKALGSPKTPGTRDLWATTDIYFHPNIRYYADGRTEPNPTGFHLVLWDDGQVEQISYEQTFFVPQGGGQFQTAFPGQAGVPFYSLTWDEFYGIKSGMVNGLRGKPVPDGQNAPMPDNGGAEALIAFVRLQGKSLTRESVWKTLDAAKTEFSLDDIQKALVEFGVATQPQALSLDQLQQKGAPAILPLKNPERIVTLAALDSQSAIVYDRGIIRAVEREILQRRYQGNALIIKDLVNDPAVTTQIKTDTVLKTTKIPNPDASIAETVTLTNTGQKPLTLQIEQPLLGLSEAQLSSQTLGAGQKATLSVALHWRPELGGTTQSTFVMIRTDDPFRPRLPIAFKSQLAAETPRK